MQISPIASTLLVIWFLIGSIVTTASLVALVLALRALNAKIEQGMEKIQPILDKADGLLVTAGDRIETISDKTESILTQGRDIAEEVHTKVDRTATAVQRTVNAPIVHSNSLLTGIRQGVSTFLQLQRGTREMVSSSVALRGRADDSAARKIVPNASQLESSLTSTTAAAAEITTQNTNDRTETPRPALASGGGVSAS